MTSYTTFHLNHPGTESESFQCCEVGPGPGGRLLSDGCLVFQVVGGVILGLTLLSQVVISSHGGDQVRASAPDSRTRASSTKPSPPLPPAGRPRRRPHRPVRHGQPHHGDRHPGGLRGPQREPSVSDRGEYRRRPFHGGLPLNSCSPVSRCLGQFLVCMVIGSLITLRTGIPAVLARSQVATPTRRSTDSCVRHC